MKYVLSLFRRSALAVSLAALASCSSGGSGGPSVSGMQPPAAPSDPQPADPDPQPAAPAPWFVDSAQVQSLTGAAPADFTDEDVRAAIDRFAQSANLLLTSDILGRYSEGVTAARSPRGTRWEEYQKRRVPCSTAQPCALDVVGALPYRFTADQDVEYQAVAVHRGVALGKSRNSYETDVALWVALGLGTEVSSVPLDGRPAFLVDEFGYGGWLEHSAFQVNVVDHFRFDGNFRYRLVRSVSIGDAAGTAPTSAGTWSGVMVGYDVDGTIAQDNVIQGDADITVTIDDGQFFPVRVDVAFTNIYELDSGRRRDDMTWVNLGVSPSYGEGFQKGVLYGSEGRLSREPFFNVPVDLSEDGSIQGYFYGPNQEEVGGVFDRNRIIGAFGASRQ